MKRLYGLLNGSGHGWTSLSRAHREALKAARLLSIAAKASNVARSSGGSSDQERATSPEASSKEAFFLPNRSKTSVLHSRM
eukprot:CAMPEP_0206630638 /NCGR_PEP_ID=MMETSP0325_2-20121206/67695_1 /ASSEMBLY_ACC=CAM_ASM_000347 /TAXON_ID=2866 /ORGANISM="Crypthecodinium cohnii, Strain Seligo" /LENGTH=80 /DNA_ID=CAMNT_0054155541 /DNA_START=13 /DNA_END=256 /DNA_ORIENTATION=+